MSAAHDSWHHSWLRQDMRNFRWQIRAADYVRNFRNFRCTYATFDGELRQAAYIIGMSQRAGKGAEHVV